MILSLIAWFAMQLSYNSVDCDPQMRNGKEYQQCAVDAPAEQTPDLSQLTDPGIVRPLKNDSRSSGTTTLWTCGVNVVCDVAPKPAEHVIEIKTRREHQVELDTEHFKQPCDAVYTLLSYPAQFECAWKVRELWIDGVRWGVVKGLE